MTTTDPLAWAIPRIALLAKGYDDEQIAWIAQTALLNPGVPVTFQGHYTFREQITRTDGGWEISGAP